MGLYICATPIGNLEDASPRLIQTLQAVDLIAAEDTRETKILCQHFSISTQIVRLDSNIENRKADDYIGKLKQGLSIALVSDAGTPTISDPGYILVQKARASGVKVVPIPGPSAPTTLLSVAGIPAQKYGFIGFLPKKNRVQAIEPYRDSGMAIACFESPQRLKQTVEEFKESGLVSFMVCGKELTKKHETVIVGSPTEIDNQLEKIVIKGEWTLILQLEPNQDPIENKVSELRQEGISSKDIQKVAKVMGWPRNHVYKLLSQSKNLNE